MRTIAYCSPFVPAEWIAAHGLRPSWLRLRSAEDRPVTGAGRGVCPFAGAVVDAVLSGAPAAGVVVTTACDQMRYAGALLERFGKVPVFVMNLPSTWQTAAVRELYLDELRRMGRFFVGLGGKSPADSDLTEVMLRYDRARATVRQSRGRLSGRDFAEALAEVREDARTAGGTGSLSASVAIARAGGTGSLSASVGATQVDSLSVAPEAAHRRNGGVPLALVGGPLVEKDYDVLDLVERAGGRVVLDATEGGERTMPAPLDPERTRRAPLEELVEAYFGSIPDVFRRPNDALYEWLGRQVTARRVRGILFRRYLWCDLWHAELQRLREWSPVPVLDFDTVGEEEGARSRTVGRLEAFLEMLR